MRLTRLLGEPAMPPLAHSFAMLGMVLAETDGLESASSMGEMAMFALYGTPAGLLSGVLTGGDEALEPGPLLSELALLALSILLAIRSSQHSGPVNVSRDVQVGERELTRTCQQSAWSPQQRCRRFPLHASCPSWSLLK